MSDESIPAGTTLLLKGGQALTPSTDWHDPSQADIAIADDKIVGVCPSYLSLPKSISARSDDAIRTRRA
jgi:hypothetical protein